MAYISELVIGNQSDSRNYVIKKIHDILKRDEILTSATLAEAVNKAAVRLNIEYIAEVEGKKTIPIELLDHVLEFAAQKPNLSNVSLVVIANAEKLSSQAQNKLLKLVEEPPEYLQVIICADDAKNILPTIKSRCLIIDNRKTIQEHGVELNKIAAGFLLNREISRVSAYNDLLKILEKKKTGNERMEILRELIAIINDLLHKYLTDKSENGGVDLMKMYAVGELLTKINRGINANVNYKLITDKLFLDLELNSVE